MSLDEWITATQACIRLGVRKQTLYAYASRKLMRVRADPEEGRRSLYYRLDVEQLAETHSRSRKRSDVASGSIKWGDPVLPTAISGIKNGTLWFGDAPATTLAKTATLEEIAARHLGTTLVGDFPLGKSQAGDSPLARGLARLSAIAPNAPPIASRGREALVRDAGQLLAEFADALIGPGMGPLHNRLATLWDLNAQDADVLRCALVLLSDHELNPSTFAVRVCASTGASLAACALAGLATLSGPKHGGVAGKTREALQQGHDGRFAEFVAQHASMTPYEYGFGHPLYPQGDPRAAMILSRLAPPSDKVQTLKAMSALLGHAPNIDAALASITLAYDLPDDAAFTLFALARITGWIGHAIEQAQNGQIIRPRARFLQN
jgi:citrate synthase